MRISDYTNKKPGRPRSAKSHAKILQATRDLLVEAGVHGVSMEGVAARAGVGKATIYRYWETKEALMSEAIGTIADEIEIPDTGDVLKDLSIVLKGMASVVDKATTTTTSNAVKKVLAGFIDSPALMEVYQEQFVKPRYQVLSEILKKGIARGELRPDINVTHVIQIIGGSYFYSLLMMDGSLSIDDWLAKIKPIIMHGIGADV